MSSQKLTSHWNLPRPLPLDIVHYIIQKVGVNTLDRRCDSPHDPIRREAIQTLSSLSLLCKDTLHWCRYYIFYAIHIKIPRMYPTGKRSTLASMVDDEKSLAEAADKILRNGYSILPGAQSSNHSNGTDNRQKKPSDYIRDLGIVFLASQSGDLPYPTVGYEVSVKETKVNHRGRGTGLAALLDQLKSLRTLRIRSKGHCRLTDAPTPYYAIGSPKLVDAISRCINTNPLRCLQFDGLTPTKSMWKLMPPSVTSLQLLGISWVSPRPVMFPPPAFTLKTLKIESPDPRLVEFLATQDSPGLLDKVETLTWISPAGCDQIPARLVRSMLSRCAQSLRNLSLDYQLSVLHDFPEVFSFPCFTALETLHIKFGPGNSYGCQPETLEQIQTFVCQHITHPCLQQIRHLRISVEIIDKRYFIPAVRKPRSSPILDHLLSDWSQELEGVGFELLDSLLSDKSLMKDLETATLNCILPDTQPTRSKVYRDMKAALPRTTARYGDQAFQMLINGHNEHGNYCNPMAKFETEAM